MGSLRLYGIIGRFILAGMCCLLLAAAGRAQELLSDDAVFGDETNAEFYNAELALQAPADAANAHGVQIALEWQAPAQYTLVTLTRTSVTVAAMKDGKAGASFKAPLEIKPDAVLHLALTRREGWLGVLVDDVLVLGKELPRAPGTNASLRPGEGWTIQEKTIRTLDPVVFADDFMRTENDFWKAGRGEWGLESSWTHDPRVETKHVTNGGTVLNPFAYRGRATAAGSAFSTVVASKPYWDDYNFTAAVQPPDDGAFGLLVNLSPDGDGLLIRWSPARDHGPNGNKLSLCRWQGGKYTVIADSSGGFVAGQWFKVSVSSSLRDGVQVSVDDKVRIPYTPVPVRRGGVGLYSESKTGTIFDDISAYGFRLNTDLIAERRFITVTQHFKDDPQMKAWAQSQSEWTAWPNTPNQWVHRFDFYGDHWIFTTVKPGAANAGQLVLALCTDGKDFTTGYRAVIARDGEGALSYTIYRGAEVLAPAKAGEKMDPTEDYQFRFLREGGRLRLQRDGETVLEATDANPLTGQRPAYRSEGAFSGARDVLVMGRNVRDYTFANAPTDWLAQGTWQPTIRWSCAPQFSFLGGWSRGDAALWQKLRFNGDQTFQAFLGIKMEYPRQHMVYENRYRSLGISICGDGVDPRSGYSVILGAPDEQGNQNRRLVLLRNGVIVAELRQPMAEKTYAHNTWFDMVLQKHGDTIDFEVRYIWKNMWWHWSPAREMSMKLSYKDPQPLEGGIPAIWTEDNGITVARARLFYSRAPQARTAPLFSLDVPEYPEWVDIGKPLSLDFSGLCTSDGKPAEMHVQAGDVPAGEEAQIAMRDGKLVFTPRKVGQHWYKLYATSGADRSPTTNIDIPVFDPALGRDDTHTLLLYRFDEGNGNIVHDRGAIGPAADLTIADTAQTHWLPGLGLYFRGPAPMKTAQNVTKLMALAKTKAGTLEFWLSPTTVDSTPQGGMCLLSWGATQDKIGNFTLSNNWYTPNLLGKGAVYHWDQEKWSGPNWISYYLEYQFHVKLQHLVVTWANNKGTVYVDGQKRTANGDLTDFEKLWTPDAPVLLGNIGNEQMNNDDRMNYIGIYYLAALYDRCLTEQEVLRHYHAGPSAR